MNRLEKALAAIPDTYLDHCPPLLDSFDAGIVAAQLIDLLESGGARQAVAAPIVAHRNGPLSDEALTVLVRAALVAYLTEQTEENTDG